MRFLLPILLLACFSLLAFASPAHAAESLSNCKGYISKLPTTISTPGTWCLKQNLTADASVAKAVIIGSDNVVLDCNDFSMTGVAGASGTSIGIYSVDRFNNTVRHCLVQGFRFGVYLQSSSGGGGHVVEDNHFDKNTSIGIRIDGDGSVARRNLVSATGGSTTMASAYGIYATGATELSNNAIFGVAAVAGTSGNAYGIYTSGNSRGTIDHNEVSGLTRGSSGNAYGIYNATSGRLTIRENDLQVRGVNTASAALTCTNANARAMGNMSTGFKTTLSGCGDAGSNDFSP